MRQPLIFGNSLLQKRKSSTLFVKQIKSTSLFFEEKKKKKGLQNVTTLATLDNDQVALR